MSTPSSLAYIIVGGTFLISLLAPAFVGWDAWFVPLAVLPFAALYVAFDRTLAKRESDGSAPSH